MRIALIIASIIVGLEILIDVYDVSKGEATNLLLHIFYEVMFILSINLLC